MYLLNMDAKRLTVIVKQAANIQITAEKARNYLAVFGEDLEEAALQGVRNLLVRHFGNKTVNAARGKTIG